MKRTALAVLLPVLAAFTCLLLGGPSYAITLSIRPVKVFLDPASGTEKLYLENTSSDAVDLQVRAYAWSQDAAGKDVYAETSELVVFPKIFKVGAGEERMLRIGTKQKPGAVERSYRIYLEEIPVAHRQTGPGPAIHMLTRVGIPVFLSPVKSAGKGKIEALALEKGRLAITVRNEGNRHWPISTVLVTGSTGSQADKGFTKEISGWYLLSGAARTYTADISRDACLAIKRITVEVKSETDSLKGGLDVDKAMCSP